MCNPRRVRVTATLEIQEAWSRVIQRSVELSGSVTGEARIRQELDQSVGAAALSALENLLRQGLPGWNACEDDFRCDVEGGYVIFHTDDRSLEIVATLSDDVSVSGSAQSELTGVLQTELSAEGEGTFYDDNYGGRGEADARRDAQAAAEKQLEQVRLQQLQAAQQQAESSAADVLAEDARRDAQRRLEQRATERRVELERQAAAHLETVGLRCRHEFHRVLASAYRDAILAYARAHGAEGLQCREQDGVVDIEFCVDR